MRLIGSVLIAALALGACASSPGAAGGRASTLHGIVFDGAGAALPGVEVGIDTPHAAGKPRLAYSDLRGRFVVPEVAHGALEISAQKPGYEPARTEAAFLDATGIVYLRLRSADELTVEADRLLAAGRPTEAMAAARRALDIAPQNPVVRYACAAIAARTGAYDDAREILAWFVASDPPVAVRLLRDLIRKETHE